MAAFVNALHLMDAALEVDAWYEWVPSKANISDLPSRLPTTWSERDAADMAALRERAEYEHRKIEWPTTAELSSFGAMAQRVRSTVAAIEAARCERC